MSIARDQIARLSHPRTRCHPLCARFRWEADAEFDEEPGEKCLTLRKDKLNEQVWYGWRLDPRELVARQPGAAQTPEAQRGARRGGCEASCLIRTAFHL